MKLPQQLPGLYPPQNLFNPPPYWAYRAFFPHHVLGFAEDFHNLRVSTRRTDAPEYRLLAVHSIWPR